MQANAEQRRYQFVETPLYAEEGCFIMNARVKPFDDQRVRTAFKHACNREALVEGALLGAGKPAKDLQGVGFPDYYGDEIEPPAFDPDRAKALLGQAGVLGDAVEISAFPGVATESAAQLYARQLNDIGMRAKVRTISPPDLFKSFPTFDNIQLLAVAVPGNQPFATSVAPRSLVSKSTFNVAGWLEPDWDRRLFAARAKPQGKERKDLFVELQREFVERSGWIVWGYQPIVNGMARAVEGVEPQGVADAPNVRDAWQAT